MKCKFTIIFFLVFITVNTVFAGGLYDLYSDNSTSREKAKSTASKVKSSINNTYTSNSYNQNKKISTDEIIKKGSTNQGQYAKANKLTNPVRIDNPYNNLNDKYMKTNAQSYSSAKTYDGTAVTFKKGNDGKLYGFNKYGMKVGTYKINTNGTITEYNNYGNKTETYK